MVLQHEMRGNTQAVVNVVDGTRSRSLKCKSNNAYTALTVVDFEAGAFVHLGGNGGAICLLRVQDKMLGVGDNTLRLNALHCWLDHHHSQVRILYATETSTKMISRLYRGNT